MDEPMQPDRQAGQDRVPDTPLDAALARLRSRKVEERLLALGDLAELADPRAFPAIASALEDPNEEVRLRAAHVLALTGGIDPLLEAAEHCRPEVREAAVVGLAHSPEGQAVEGLVARVADLVPRVAAQAVWELVLGGTERGLEVGVEAALGSPEKAVRERATQALEGFGNLHLPFLLHLLESPPASDPEKAITIAVNALVRNPHPDAVEPLIRVLETSTGPLREAAVQVLGKTQDPRAIPSLRRLLPVNEPRLQREVITALAHLWDRESAEAIRELLSSARNMHVRVAAIQALARMADRDSIDAIFRAGSDPQHLVRLAAVETLPWVSGNDRRVVPFLCLALRDEHPKVRLAAATALVCHANLESVPALQERLDQRIEPDAKVRARAREALTRIRGVIPAAPDLSSPTPAGPIYTGTVTAYDPALSTVGPVPTALRCKSCGGPCHELLVVPGEQIGRAGRTFRVIRCLNCYFEGPYRVYFRGDRPTRVAYEYAEDQEFFEGSGEPPVLASIRWVPGPPDMERAAWGWETLAGGSPAWLQNGEWPQCSTCGRDMEFILQLASSGLDRSQSDGEIPADFYLSIENYATLYFFDCPPCEVTASVCECT